MSDERSKTLRDQRPTELLKWYDRNARVMPWRVGPHERANGERPDPYHVWLSEIMLQQTTVATVRDYFRRFVEEWPTVHALAAAPDADVMAAWAGLGYYARARNLLKCARVVSGDLRGKFPANVRDLQSLPGIGPYTAAAIAAIAFDQPEAVVDGNVERVMSRLFSIRQPLPGAKKEIRKCAEYLTPKDRPGDYAQAVMDLGATICTPKSPACGICPLLETCLARKKGIEGDLPAKTPKKAKPVKLGFMYVGRTTNGDWILERRPPRGLLGGTLGWPGSEWTVEQPKHAVPFLANWHEHGVGFRHTFTHFHLDVTVYVSAGAPDVMPGDYVLADAAGFDASDLPTLMRKAFQIAQSWEGWRALQPECAPVK